MFDHTSLNDLPHTTQGSDAGLCETQAASTLIRQGKFLTLKQDIARLPDGHNASHEHLVHPGAMMMIPLLDDGTALVECRFRCPVDRVMTEFSAGELDPQERALACDKREPREETGHMAERWDYLMHIHSVISYFIEFIDIYLTRDLRQEEVMLNEGKFLETSIVSAGQLIDWVRDGKVLNVKIIIGMF